MLLTATLGEKVVSKATAETLGAVDGVVIDAARREITGLWLGTGRKAKIVAWADVHGVGTAAAVVENEDAVRAPNEGAEQHFARGDIGLIGALVLSDLGNAYGTVADVEYDADTGTIESIRIAGSTHEFIAADRLRAVGTYAWVVAAGDDET